MSGVKGVKGDKGDKGEKGDTGEQGEKGNNMLIKWVSTKAPLIVIVLFLILAVMSFSTAVLARQTQAAIKKADLVVQCTTPGTKCYQLSQAAAVQRVREIKAGAFCILDAISTIPIQDIQSHRAELLTQYNACVTAASAPDSPVTSTTTTTTIK